jgi:hypothetical protein
MNRRIVLASLSGVLLAVLTACGGGGGGSNSSSSSTGGTTTVSGPPISVSTTTLPDGVMGKSYSAQLTATGGIQPYTWALASSLPFGLSLSKDGLVSGTVQGWGGDVVVQLQDSGVPKQTITKRLTVVVYSELSILTTSVPDGHTNVPYDFVVQSFDVKTWAITAGQLPAGVQLAAPSRTQVEMKGTPSQKGNFTFTIEAQSVSNPPQVASKTFTLVIDDNPAVLNAQVLDVIRNKPYQDTLVAVNGTPPYHWSSDPATWPPGITWNADTGVISGTYTNPVFQNIYGTTVTVTDSGSPARSSSRMIPIFVVEQLGIGGGSVQNATLNQPYYGYNYSYGGRPPFAWSISSGSLPAGLSLNATEGTIVGSPSQLGDYGFSLHVRDSTNPPQTADLPITIKVTPPILSMSYSLPNRIPKGAPFSGFVAAQGGTPPYTWQLQTGSLPTGLQLNSSTGEVSGTPTALGGFPFTAKVTDSGSPQQTASQAFNVDVVAPLGRNNSIAKATLIGNGSFFGSISPYADPVDVATPDVDYYKLVLSNGTAADISTWAKQSNGSDPLDSVIEIVDVNGVRLHFCNAPTVPNGAFTGPCLNDDIQDGIVQDSRLFIKTPGTTGSTTIYVKVSDWRGDARPDMTYYLQVNGAVDPLVSMSTLAPGMAKGSNFSQQLTSRGGAGAVGWSVSAGALPPGLTLSSTGLLSGIATTNGTYGFTLTATDAGTPPQTASQQYTFVVADPVKIVSSANMPGACLGKPYTFTMQYTGGVPPVQWNGSFGWYSIGLGFDFKTSTWSGVPSQIGTFNMGISAVDAVFNFDSQNLTLNVKNCP